MNLTHFNHTLKVLLKYHVMDLECVFKIYAFADFCRRFFLSSWKWIQVSTKLVSSPDVASLASWRAWLICLLMKVYLHIHTFYIVCVYKYLPLEKTMFMCIYSIIIQLTIHVYIHIVRPPLSDTPCVLATLTALWQSLTCAFILKFTCICILNYIYTYIYTIVFCTVIYSIILYINVR